MPLPASDPQRVLQHTRAVQVEMYSRADGLWEVDARLRDTKTREIRGSQGVLPAGEAIHDLVLRLVIDTQFHIHRAGAESLAVPYRGQCDDHGDAYAQLEGLNLMKGFKRAVRERLGGVAGCTHLTELADVLPTAVIQAFAGLVLDTKGEGDQAPFQLDRCHALRRDGEVVRLHYPRWFRQPDANKVSENHAPVTPAASRDAASAARPLSS